MVKLFLRRPRLESKVKGTIHICINTTKLEHKLYSNDIELFFSNRTVKIWRTLDKAGEEKKSFRVGGPSCSRENTNSIYYKESFL